MTIETALLISITCNVLLAVLVITREITHQLELKADEETVKLLRRELVQLIKEHHETRDPYRR